MKFGLTLSDKIDNNIFFRNLISCILFLVRLINKTTRSNNKKDATLVISFHRLGDAVFTLPSLSVVNRNSKNLFLFCFTECLPIYKEYLKNINIIAFDKDSDFLFGKIPKAIIRNTLRELNADQIFDLTASIQSAFLLMFSSARFIIGANNLIYRNLYDHFCIKRRDPHLMDLYLDIVKLKYNCTDELQLKKFRVKSSSVDTIFIHPTAGWQSKEWGLNNFIKLAIQLNKKYSCCIIFPPGYLDEDIKEYLVGEHLKFMVPDDTTSLLDMLRTGDIFIGNDSGPAHIASLLGLKTFIIFGPTNPVYHIPYGDFHSNYNRTIKCSPLLSEKMCFANGGLNGCPSNECMRAISVDEVFDSVSRFLQKKIELE